MRSSFYSADVIEALAERTEGGHDTVVDVGTGTGFVAAGLAGRVRTVIGVDNSQGMLAVARSNLAALGATNVVTLEGDLDALPLADNPADVAVANMVLHHAPNPPGMVVEMARVIRPGGKIVITDAIRQAMNGCAPSRPTSGSASRRPMSRPSSLWPAG